MNSVVETLDKIEEKVSTKPCQVQFAKIVIKPSDKEAIANQFELSLFVDYRWWSKLEFNEEVKTLFISLNKHDLRVRHAPSKGSHLKLFDRHLEIDHLANDLEVDINASLKITKALKWPGDSNIIGGFEATLEAGSVRLSTLNATIKSDWSWLDPGESQETELLLGSSRIQLKLPHQDDTKNSLSKPMLKLFEFKGSLLKNKKTEYLWKLESCAYEDLYSPEILLKSYQTKIIEIAKSVHEGRTIEVVKTVNSDPGIYYLVGSTPSIYLKPGLQIKIFQEKSESQVYDPPLIWEPQSLRVLGGADNESFQLIDYDEVELLLDPANPKFPETSFELKVEWKKEDYKREIDFNYHEHLVAPTEEEASSRNYLYLARTTNKDVVNQKNIWGLAKIKDSKEEYSWMRYSLNEFGGNSELNLKTKNLPNPSGNLSGRVLKFYDFERNVDRNFDTPPWTIQIDLLDQKTYGITNRLEMIFSTNNVKLKIHKPSILAKSPSMVFYGKKLRDPYSLHSEMLWKDHLKEASLVFYNEPNPSNLAVANGAIRLYQGENKEIQFLANEEQVFSYQIAHMAVIDRVSASSNNLPVSVVPGVGAYNRLYTGNGAAVIFKRLESGELQLIPPTGTIDVKIKDYKECWIQLTKSVQGVSDKTFTASIKSTNRPAGYFVLDEVFLDQLGVNELGIDNSGAYSASELEISITRFQFRLPQITAPRDPGNGYIAVPLKKFRLIYQVEDLLLDAEPNSSTPVASFSAESLMPWVERKFIAARNEATDAYSLYHRNLVLEHGEFELAREYANLKKKKTTYNASEAFIQATRDRYCLASELTSDSKLENWLPQAQFQDKDEDPITSKLSYSKESTSENRKFPEVRIEWMKGNDSIEKLKQNLGIHLKDTNWLEYYVKPEFADSAKPKLQISEIVGKSPPEGYKRTINSYTPLLFHSKRYFDNLGIVRPETTAVTQTPWKIEEFETYEGDQKKSYFSISVANEVLIDHATSSENTSYLDVTQLIATFDGFKVNMDGTVPTLSKINSGVGNYHNTNFNLGVFGFFSNIESYSGSIFQAVDRWPRYKGIPFLVTEIQSFKINTQRKAPEEILFSAVFANPEQLLSINETETIPAFVLHALTRNKLVQLKYSFGSDGSNKLEIVQGSIDWVFSVSRQLSLANSSDNLPGRLAYIEASVADQEAPKTGVELTVNESASKALALNKLWNLEEENLKLTNSGLFFRSSRAENSSAQPYTQVQYEFTSIQFKKTWSESTQVATVFHQDLNALSLPIEENFKSAVLCRLINPERADLLSIKQVTQVDDRYFFFLDSILALPDEQTVECQFISYQVNEAERPPILEQVYQGNAIKYQTRQLQLKNTAQIALNQYNYQSAVCKRSDDPDKFYIIKEYEIIKIDPTRTDYVITLDSTWVDPADQTPFEIEILEHPFLQIATRKIDPLLYHLDIDLSFQQSLPGRKLEAMIAYPSRLKLHFLAPNTQGDLKRSKRLLPNLIQSNFYCLSVDALSKPSHEGSLILWIENRKIVPGSLTELPYSLAGLLTENASFGDPLARFYLKGKPSPIDPVYTSGLHIHYLNGSNPVRSYSLLTLILRGENFILRFEDQDFTDLHDLISGAPETGENSSKTEKTGYLQLFTSSSDRDNETGPQFQGPVVATFRKKGDGKVILTVEQSYYAKNSFEPIRELSSLAKPDIDYYKIPSDSDPAPLQYNLREVKVDMDHDPYLSLENTTGPFVLKKMDKKHIPLNFCLEPNAFSSLTKLKQTQPILVHRLLFGRLLRLDLEGRFYHRQDLVDTQNKIEDEMEIEGQYLLSPLATDENEKLALMRDHVFLVPNSQPERKVQTELVMVYNRPTSQNANLRPFFTLSQHSLDAKEIQKDIFNSKSTRKKILEVGANGIAIHRKIDSDGRISYQYIPSPFHDVEGEEHLSDQRLVHMLVDLRRFSINKSEVESPSVARDLDFRSINPTFIKRIQSVDDKNRYEVFDDLSETIKNEDCAVPRVISYRYRGQMNEAYQNDTVDKQPSIYLYETPAFRNMEPLWYLPPKEQDESHRHKTDILKELSAYFLPYQLQLKYGPDKPGAMFHHELRNVVHNRHTSAVKIKGQTPCELGQGVDFAMREAQQIKVDKCVSAEVENLTFEELSNSQFHIRHLKANWDDVFGRVSLNDLPNTFEASVIESVNEELFEFKIKDDLRKKLGSSTFKPLKLIYQHNYDILELKDLDASIPAYIEERRQFKWWSNLYLSSKIESVTLNVPYEFKIDDPTEAREKQTISLDFKPYLAITKFEIVSSTANSITVKRPPGSSLDWLNSLKSHLKIFVPALQGIHSDKANTLPFGVESISITDTTLIFELQNLSKFYNQDVFISQPLHLLLPLKAPLISQVDTEADHHLWKINLKSIPLSKIIRLQIMWVAAANRIIKLKDTGQILTVQQMSHFKMYNIEKQIKLLMPSLTSPKVAGVLHLDYEGGLHPTYRRTIFFGNSAGLEKAKVMIEAKSLNDHHFKMFAPDQQEVEVAYPAFLGAAGANYSTSFYLVKYMTRGQVVYGEWSSSND